MPRPSSPFRISHATMIVLIGLTPEELTARGVPTQVDYDLTRVASLAAQVSFTEHTRVDQITTLKIAADKMGVSVALVRGMIALGVMPSRKDSSGATFVLCDWYRFWRTEKTAGSPLWRLLREHLERPATLAPIPPSQPHATIPAAPVGTASRGTENRRTRPFGPSDPSKSAG